ncbi:hypothetical protein ACQKDS_03110 [Serratia sp. NPDC078593]|uniref:hypothetical protein n=1 Tax=unclassified Serratia (in: enterobacteria) TaxID=2647522 RepID=UPI0037D3AE93
MKLTIVIPLLTGLLLSTNLMAAEVTKIVPIRVLEACKSDAKVKGLTGDDYTKFVNDCVHK